MPAKAVSLFVVRVAGAVGVAVGCGDGVVETFADGDATDVRTVAFLVDADASVVPFAVAVVVCFGPLLTTFAPPDVFAFPSVQLATQHRDRTCYRVVVIGFYKRRVEKRNLLDDFFWRKL